MMGGCAELSFNKNLKKAHKGMVLTKLVKAINDDECSSAFVCLLRHLISTSLSRKDKSSKVRVGTVKKNDVDATSRVKVGKPGKTESVFGIASILYSFFPHILVLNITSTVRTFFNESIYTHSIY